MIREYLIRLFLAWSSCSPTSSPSQNNNHEKNSISSLSHPVPPAGDPPTLIFQGSIDSLVPVSQSDSLHVWLDRAGIPNEYHRLKGWPHTMDVSQKVFNSCTWYMDDLFQKIPLIC